MAWSADYPQMERSFTTILAELTSMPLYTDGSNVHTLDDPELFKYPVAYLTEPGYWIPSVAEADGLRAWLAKGGFRIVDDFYFQQQWDVFEQGMRMVLPDAQIMPLDRGHQLQQRHRRLHGVVRRGMVSGQPVERCTPARSDSDIGSRRYGAVAP